ncbi:MAG TPA: type II toxin-antitoxin system VapC family toxin [Methylomirabilota bacterium]|nr:type II toxin-antitoxin system VapC family toxin [Methylomirabilota bacterium]
MNRTKIVVDTSVIIKWLSSDKEDHLDFANKLLEDALEGAIELLAPELSKYEVGNVLLFSKKLSSQQGAEVLAQFYTLPINFITESDDLSTETYDLAFTLGITYYDASFISLAKQNGAILVTENIKHQGKSKDIMVKSLQDY